MSNVTHRVTFDYVSNSQAGYGKEHSIQLRIIDTQQSDESIFTSGTAIISTFLNAVGAANLVAGWRVLRGRVSRIGTDFSLPMQLTPGLESFVGTGSVSGWSGDKEAVQWTWVGRSRATGKRTRLSIYGVKFTNLDPSFRVLPNEAAWVKTASDVLTAAADLVTIDGTPAIWYDYVNVQYNSYWERKIRRVG